MSRLVEVPFVPIAWTLAMESMAGRCRVVILMDKQIQADNKEVIDSVLYALGRHAGQVDPAHIATNIRGQRFLLEFLKENWKDNDPDGLLKLIKG